MPGIKKGKNNLSWFYFGFIALNTFFGIGILKMFLSLLVNFYRERPNVSLIDMGIYALITFMLVFLTGFLFRLFNYKTLAWILIGGVSAARFLLQFTAWAPLSLAISALGTLLWITSFIFFISVIQQGKIDLFVDVMPGLIAGISFYSAMHALFGTWDMIWRSEPAVSLIILFLTSLQLWIIFNISKKFGEIKAVDGRNNVFYTLIVIAPWFLLQMLKFQNVASHTATAGFNLTISLVIILASNTAAFCIIFLFRFKKTRLLLTLAASILALLSFWPGAAGYLYTLQIIFGQIGFVWILLVTLNKAAGSYVDKVPWKNTFAIGISGIIFFIFAFAYYGSYEISLPFENWIVPIFLAAAISICGLFSISSANVNYKNFKPVYAIMSLLIIPVLIAMPARYTCRPVEEKSSIRVVNYNIHQGFNIDGYLDLESIARLIESSGADVVSLQEVSRGWVINSSADTLSFLSERLGMEYIFMPASDSIWGNAVLSKYPIKLIRSDYLPRFGAPLRRSFLLVGVELTKIEDINILCTHLHHTEDEGCIRESQVSRILAGWGGLERTLIMGDFNAETGDPEIEKMYQAGLVDSQKAIGEGEGLTWVHYEPYRRIDYIWATPDLEIFNLEVPCSTASDHLPTAISVK